MSPPPAAGPAKRLVLLGLATLLLPAAAGAGDVAAGRQAYQTFCRVCHGETGRGDGPVGQTLTPPPRDFTEGRFRLDADGDGEVGSDADLVLVITHGAQKYGGSEQMAPWGSIGEDRIRDLVAYVRSLRP